MMDKDPVVIDLPLRLPERAVLDNAAPDVDRQNEQRQRDQRDCLFIKALEHLALRLRDGLNIAATGKEPVNDGSLLRPASRPGPFARLTRADADRYRRVLRPFAALLAALWLGFAPAPAEAAGGLYGLMGELRARYGNGCCRVISGYRPGALVAGTNMRSCHATGQAIDVILSGPAKAHVLRTRFGIIRYASGHWHISSCARELGIRAFR